MVFRVEELLELWMGVEENRLLFLFRAIATDDVDCREQGGERPSCCPLPT